MSAGATFLDQDADWGYLAAVPDALRNGQFSPAAFRQVLDGGSDLLRDRFAADEAVEDLVRDRARLVDVALRAAWVRHAGRFAEDLALVAVGGYGRGELHPSSDIDIMVLLPKSDSADWQSDIEKFLTFLWDIGLEVGHSVRSIDDCQRESLADISVATTLFEARLLAGPESLFAGMRRALAPDRLWSSQDFFEAKVREQTERHHRYFDTAYNLEPNVKSSPGGLRDIQTIGWVAKRHFGTDTLDELVAHGFLTREELRKLKAGQSFLWKVRFGLHVLTGRREDRLLFDYQIKLAKLFGYEDASFTLAVEQLMQKYYRTVMDVSLLNEMLLQLFREAILTQSEPPIPLNARFQIRNDYLEVAHPEVFARYPSALLELFVLLQQHPELRGVRAETIRLIGAHVSLIDEEFRQNPRHHRLFMEILCAPVGVTHELRRMNLYGVLGRYIPSFGRVVGRMQYDLFHAYTVDAHTLFVVSNLRHLAMPKFNHEFPVLSQIMQSLPRQELAYLAALFHDIAKGRGGDHSELGAVDAEAFCLEQGLGRYEARLVAWLVRNHLILSITSQKKDISDPDIIHSFARQVGDQAHLDYLYVLTVADVRGTNPKLWNAWKARLFEEFYERTKRALRRGLETPVDQDELIRETQANARARIPAIAEERIAKVWSQWTEAYFLRYTPEEIAWHTTLLADRSPADDAPLVAVRQLAERAGTAVLTYTPNRVHSFARTTALLDQMGLNVVDARLITSANGFNLETYVVLEDNGAVITDPSRIGEIERGLWRNLQQSEDSPLTVTRRAPRQVRMFSTPTQVNFSLDNRNNRTILELIAAGPSRTLVRGRQGVQDRASGDKRSQDHDCGRARGRRVLHYRYAGTTAAAGSVPAGSRLPGAGSRSARRRQIVTADAYQLQALIESAYESRADITPTNASADLRAAVETAIGGLDAGTLRVAEKRGGNWHVNQWLKKAVLLSFRIAPNAPSRSGDLNFYDKVPLKYGSWGDAQFAAAGVRVVPPATVRRGAFIAANAVLMPSYVNIGAYVDSGTMVDTWATVGSCAQIGKNVHLSGGVGIGGVLEPLQANPTIIEDNCFIGARSEIVEGVIVEAGAVVSMGVFIGQSTRIYDRERDEILYGRVPAGAVVVPGSLPSASGKYSLACAVIVKRVDEQTRAKTSTNELLRNIV